MLTAAVAQRTLSLVGELQVHHLHDIKADMGQALDESDLAAVDVSGINDVDLAGLQILLAFLVSAGHRSTPCKLRGVQPSLRKAIELCGLEQSFASFIA